MLVAVARGARLVRSASLFVDDTGCRQWRSRVCHGLVLVVTGVVAGLRQALHQHRALGRPPRLTRAYTSAQIRFVGARALLALGVDEALGSVEPTRNHYPLLNSLGGPTRVQTTLPMALREYIFHTDSSMPRTRGAKYLDGSSHAGAVHSLDEMSLPAQRLRASTTAAGPSSQFTVPNFDPRPDWPDWPLPTSPRDAAHQAASFPVNQSRYKSPDDANFEKQHLATPARPHLKFVGPAAAGLAWPSSAPSSYSPMRF